MRRSNKFTTADYIWMAIGIIITILLLFPVYLMIMYGFETLEDMFHIPPYWFPPNITFEPLIETFSGLKSNIINSLIVAIGCLGITLFTAPFAGYALAHHSYRFGKYVNFALILSQMFPVVMLSIPVFIMYSNVGLVNTYAGLILADATYTIPLCTLILAAYMRSIPFELIEAALIDGASHFTTFFRVVVPVAKSGIATSAIFAFLLPWADFLYALVLAIDNKIQPMSVGLYKYMELYGLRWNNLMAGGFIFSIPALVVVTLAGKFIVKGLTAGALKQ
ncbi:MAG: carbohydrate ABC transporter permease [Atribacterales bacterium]|jgi:multiple sugar transport system permease protein